MAGIQIGFDKLYYATVTKDDATGVTYATPVPISGAISAKVSTKTNSATLYADDSAAEVATVVGETEVEFNVKDLPVEAQAILLGHSVAKGVLVKKSTDVSPYVAMGFRAKKSNGKYKYVWLLKGKFETTDIEAKTTEDKADFQTATIKGTFVAREYDKAYIRLADADATEFVETTATNWFTAVEPVV